MEPDPGLLTLSGLSDSDPTLRSIKPKKQEAFCRLSYSHANTGSILPVLAWLTLTLTLQLPSDLYQPVMMSLLKVKYETFITVLHQTTNSCFLLRNKEINHKNFSNSGSFISVNKTSSKHVFQRSWYDPSNVSSAVTSANVSITKRRHRSPSYRHVLLALGIRFGR